MINAIINITITFVSLKEECDEGGIWFFFIHFVIQSQLAHF